MHQSVDLIFVELPLYTALVACACAVGLFTTYLYFRFRARRAATRALFYGGAVIVFAMGWLGARAFHVILNWEYYAARPDEIAQFGAGGLGWRGGVLAGLGALWLLARLHKIPFLKIADGAALGVVLGQALGWYAALGRGANYGSVSDSPIALELPDIYGLVEPRAPVQPAAIGLFALLFAALVALAARRPRAGALFFSALAVTAWGNFALGFARGDESAQMGPWRVDQMVDAAMGATAILGFIGWKLSDARKQNRLD